MLLCSFLISARHFLIIAMHFLIFAMGIWYPVRKSDIQQANAASSIGFRHSKLHSDIRLSNPAATASQINTQSTCHVWCYTLLDLDIWYAIIRYSNIQHRIVRYSIIGSCCCSSLADQYIKQMPHQMTLRHYFDSASSYALATKISHHPS
jgi:hypothetical protein